MIPGVLVGRQRDVTVVLVPPGTVGAVDARGAAPVMRETDALEPENLVRRVDAVCLAGGGSFGLAATDGVLRWLAERNIGFPVGNEPHEVVPIVPAAAFLSSATPGLPDGYAACEAAEPFVASDEVDGVTVGALAVGGPGSTLATVVVTATLSKAEARRIAVAGQDGIARAVHATPVGDVVFALAVGGPELSDPLALDAVCAMVAEVVSRAIMRS